VAVIQYTFTHKQYTERQKITILGTTQKQYIKQHKNILLQCGPCPFLASYTLAFALQLRKKYGKASVRLAEK
jgi:hypothetical protein